MKLIEIFLISSNQLEFLDIMYIKIYKKIPINCLEFSDDGTRLLTADDYTLNIYDTQIGK